MREAGFPEAWIQRLPGLVPAERLQAAAEHFLAPRPVALRVNTLRLEPRTAAAALARDGLPAEPVAWSAAAFTVDPRRRALLVRHPLVEQGDVYPQGLASQLAAFVLDPRPGEAVLDLCAAPGGKTLDLAARLGPGADLAAVEASKPRFFRLRANLERAGAGSVRTYLHDGRRTGDKVPGRFDAVLLDAPCSGDTRLRGGDDPSAWSVSKARRLGRKQRDLLASAIRCTRPGGRVLYATCSMCPEENEAVIDAALRGGAVAAEPVELPAGLAIPGLGAWRSETFDAGVTRARRVLPAGPHEGFFLALLRVR
ncbi:RsmB/NOP family class I SAM-dependent RNA methyltransferase [Phycisphaera mikurensis]|uniref:Putative RNA methyltransferase n=1 Tax=Phycisphaera mikurensis (strain NBRC 102666 / KCTC 22515 / FYK2301M01) TaxID=1142394 RepID=I0ID70_PHYMF|nr:RsmB/NOP family class I SAM-dependent RNA methyltransferase [Phycisphaera mikurensis]MBB6442334.1 16S rRNA (cytosine1407-C5)-methyltransferase [Phycisphaera mikurensis]BAM03208.1 putative RNA methyltransferase [Phycisphaera mikurensis NBRC 102666]